MGTKRSPNEETLQIPVAPKILTPMRDIKVKAGNPLSLEVEFVGEPEPTVQWKMDDSDTPLSATITTVAGRTSIFIPAAAREDSGEYQLHLRNSNGSDRGAVKITVQGLLPLSYL